MRTLTLPAVTIALAAGAAVPAVQPSSALASTPRCDIAMWAPQLIHPQKNLDLVGYGEVRNCPSYQPITAKTCLQTYLTNTGNWVEEPGSCKLRVQWTNGMFSESNSFRGFCRRYYRTQSTISDVLGTRVRYSGTIQISC
jgi:hypothetical protein